MCGCGYSVPVNQVEFLVDGAILWILSTALVMLDDRLFAPRRVAEGGNETTLKFTVEWHCPASGCRARAKKLQSSQVQLPAIPEISGSS